MKFPRVVIAAAGSGSGKTTVTMAILSALVKQNRNVQAYKCGPDYIDPGYHARITGRPSRNLDSWFVKPRLLKNIFLNNSRDSDISVIEGVMGLYDGKSPVNNSGSTAEISRILNTPVVLVLDARSMARSAAAVIKGFQLFNRQTKISAVILNKCGSQNHIEILKEAIEKECKIPVIGALLRNPDIQIPERHLGLLPAVERGELKTLFTQLGKIASESIDLEQFVAIAQSAPDYSSAHVDSAVKYFSHTGKTGSPLSIAVAFDHAFNFYYPENIDLLKKFNLKPVFFSPLKNEPVPDGVTGLYIGGGFPEEFASILSKNTRSLKSIIHSIENYMPVLAECGGFMYLTDAIKTQNKSYKMCGIIPGSVEMMESKTALGYREIEGLENNFLLPPGKTIKGHEFHYSRFIPASKTLQSAYKVTGRKTSEESGFIYKNMIAGYPHFYFLSNPDVLENWYHKCQEFNNGKLVRSI